MKLKTPDYFDAFDDMLVRYLALALAAQEKVGESDARFLDQLSKEIVFAISEYRRGAVCYGKDWLKQIITLAEEAKKDLFGEVHHSKGDAE
jgi:hypothetical protein